MTKKLNRPSPWQFTLSVGVVVTLLTITGQAQQSPNAAASRDSAVTPFKINIDDSILEDLHVRLDRTRFPDQLDGAGWDYGTDLDYLKELVQYWRTKFDWRKQERKLNKFPQFTTDIDGLQIHIFQKVAKLRKIYLIKRRYYIDIFVKCLK